MHLSTIYTYISAGLVYHVTLEIVSKRWIYHKIFKNIHWQRTIRLTIYNCHSLVSYLSLTQQRVYSFSCVRSVPQKIIWLHSASAACSTSYLQSAIDPLSVGHIWIARAANKQRSVFCLTLLSQPTLSSSLANGSAIHIRCNFSNFNITWSQMTSRNQQLHHSSTASKQTQTAKKHKD